MLIRGATQYQIEQATARTPGVGLTYLQPKGRAFRVKLGTSAERPARYGRRGFRVRKDGERSQMHSCLCWHGFRAWMRMLYQLAPDATICTGIITYRGAEDFERNHDWTGDRNIGSQMQPLAFRDACDCENN